MGGTWVMPTPQAVQERWAGSDAHTPSMIPTADGRFAVLVDLPPMPVSVPRRKQRQLEATQRIHADVVFDVQTDQMPPSDVPPEAIALAERIPTDPLLPQQYFATPDGSRVTVIPRESKQPTFGALAALRTHLPTALAYECLSFIPFWTIWWAKDTCDFALAHLRHVRSLEIGDEGRAMDWSLDMRLYQTPRACCGLARASGWQLAVLCPALRELRIRTTVCLSHFRDLRTIRTLQVLDIALPTGVPTWQFTQVSLNPQLLVDKNNTTLRVLRLPCADVRTGLNLSSNYLEELDLRPIRVEKAPVSLRLQCPRLRRCVVAVPLDESSLYGLLERSPDLESLVITPTCNGSCILCNPRAACHLKLKRLSCSFVYGTQCQRLRVSNLRSAFPNLSAVNLRASESQLSDSAEELQAARQALAGGVTLVPDQPSRKRPAFAAP